MQTMIDRQTDLMMWFMTMGSGGSSRLVRRWGISENFRRGQSKICKSTLQWNGVAREMSFRFTCSIDKKWNPFHLFILDLYRCVNNLATNLTNKVNLGLRGKFSSFSHKLHLLKVFITVDVLLVMGVLQLVGFDVLPQSLDDARACLSVDTQQPSKPRIQLELRRLQTREPFQ